MNYTTNYNLKMPEQTDYYNVDDFNENINVADTKIKDLYDRKLEGTTGTYTGTGTAGSGNANSLTFTFDPIYVHIVTTTGEASAIIRKGGAVNMVASLNTNTTGVMSLSAAYNSGNHELTWWDTTYSGAEAARQLNTKDQVYAYVAIGK